MVVGAKGWSEGEWGWGWVAAGLHRGGQERRWVWGWRGQGTWCQYKRRGLASGGVCRIWQGGPCCRPRHLLPAAHEPRLHLPACLARSVCAERFGALYAHVPRVRVPKIKWEATSRRVLTMEWIDGIKLTDQVGETPRSVDGPQSVH